jgi:hypothetical protein
MGDAAGQAGAACCGICCESSLRILANKTKFLDIIYTYLQVLDAFPFLRLIVTQVRQRTIILIFLENTQTMLLCPST